MKNPDCVRQSGGKSLYLFTCQAFQKRDYRHHVIFIQLLQQVTCLLIQRKIVQFLVKELMRRDIEVLADLIELAHGRQGTSGADILDIAFILPKIQAHLVF